MIGLRERLLQKIGRPIILLPAWPREWDVDFKLYAPGQTRVGCAYRQGCIAQFVVTPASRQQGVTVTP